MAFKIARERHPDVAGAYRRYQEYLRDNEDRFPPGAYALGTAPWWQDANDHRSPHDAWLETVVISEPSAGERGEQRSVAIRVRLLGAWHDGWIELHYPRVYGCSFGQPDCVRGLGGWRYDEFRLSEAGHLIHEIEWSGFPGQAAAGWLIEASDVNYQWLPR